MAIDVPYPIAGSYLVSQDEKGTASHTDLPNNVTSTPLDWWTAAYDFALPMHTPVLAVAPGIVVDFGEDVPNGTAGPAHLLGNFVTVLFNPDTPNQFYGTYAHLAFGSVLPAVGDHVQAGTVLAQSGDTGRSTTPHLHFQFSLELTSNPGILVAYAHDAYDGLVSFSGATPVSGQTVTGSLVPNLNYGPSTAPGKTVTGTTGNDSLAGASSNDTIVGLAGADTMSGGFGNDVYSADNVGDVVIEARNAGNDTVFAEVNYVLPANVEALILVGAALNGTGNSLLNYIYGNGGPNRLDGGAGGDALIGYAGNDTLVGGEGIDGMAGGAGDDTYAVDSIYDVILENPGEGNDVVFATTTHTLYANVESLILVGSADSWAIGNAGGNFLFGNSGINYIDAAGGADVMSGGGGTDVFRLRLLETHGDMITDFGADDLIQFQGYAAATSTVTSLGGGLWQVRDAATGAAETFGLSNGFTLTAANYAFV